MSTTLSTLSAQSGVVSKIYKYKYKHTNTNIHTNPFKYRYKYNINTNVKEIQHVLCTRIDDSIGFEHTVRRRFSRAEEAVSVLFYCVYYPMDGHY